MIVPDEMYIQRCFDLASLGKGAVSPNPLVGAVIVYNNRIIGEGYHQRYGQAHAEVNAVGSVQPDDLSLLPESTLYVSLEPCNFHGNTPACTDLILKHRFKRVVVSALDFTPQVSGQGIKTLENAGIEVKTKVKHQAGIRLSQTRNTFVTKQRPFIRLKFARTADHKFGLPNQQVWISNAYTKRLTHKLRSETDAILIGTRTAELDDPQLTNRLYFGKSPKRFVLDRRMNLPPTLNLFRDGHPTTVFTELAGKLPYTPQLKLVKMDFNESLIPQMLDYFYQEKISNLFVEGGAQLLHSFIDQNSWDEAYVFENPNRSIPAGIPAPVLAVAPEEVLPFGDNQLFFYRKG